jgi:2-(1,2-epoxy-1,2-dihydrophenyl)acetyl-CoA isomerase
MSPNSVRVQKKDKIGTIVLNRPKIMNAMNEELILELQDALQRMEKDEDIRVVIIKGAGNHFCSGADMNLLAQEASSDQWLQSVRQLGRVIQQIREIPQPVITRIRGVAAGGGANLALAGDFVLAAEDARFIQIFIHLGLILDAGGTFFLPRLVGLAKARELAMLGNEIDGTTAAAIGLIYKSVPHESLDHEVESLANNLALKQRTAISLIKQGLDASFDKTLIEMLDWEAAHQAIMLQTPQAKEIARQFIASRKKNVKPSEK